MATIKENKGKEVVDEVVRQGKTQPRPSIGEKRKSISKGVDLGNFPSRRKEKKAKHKLSKAAGARTTSPVLPVHDASIQILDIDLDPKDPLSVQIPSMAKMPSLSQPISCSRP